MTAATGCCDVEKTCRGRSSARSAAGRGEEKKEEKEEEKEEGRVATEVDSYSSSARRHQYQPSYCVRVNVRAATEDVIARLVTDADVKEVRVHWRDGDCEMVTARWRRRDGDSEPLNCSISVAALAVDAVYLDLRNRRSK